MTESGNTGEQPRYEERGGAEPQAEDQPTTTFGPPADEQPTTSFERPPMPGPYPPAPPSSPYPTHGYGQQQQSGYSPYQQPGYGSQPGYGYPQDPGYQQTQAYQPVPGYPQGGYGQQPQGYSPYQQPSYGQGYEQQQGYGYQQPAYGTQPGYGEPAPAPAKRGHAGLWASIAAVVAVIVALVLISYFAKVPSSWYTTKLSHTAVEKYITERLGATNVSCNGGKDFPMKRDGATFTCTAAGGKTFTVTIKDKSNGAYVVQ